MDSCEGSLSLLTNDTFVRQSELDTVTNVKDNNLPFKKENDMSRGNLLLGIFQKNTPRETLDFAKEVENNASRVQREKQRFQFKVDSTSKVFQKTPEGSREKNCESTEERLAKEVKLIRIFPGPAGLVQDVKDDNISAVSYLSSIEELGKSKPRAIKRIEIKAHQDEKNLCGEEAWKLLLNDLPKNFLQDYKISIVKDKANASHCDSTKVRFIAGVVDYVDNSHDDPFVILKDSTGSIEGTIHRDILLTYPGILEPNVVIFLRDVGLLKTTTYVVTNKYHILVSLVNLLAIYSDKGRIVSTSLMESILSHTSNIELNRINDHMSVSKPAYISELQKVNEDCKTSASSSINSSSPKIKAHEPRLANDLLSHPTSEMYKNCGKTLKNDKNCKVTDGTRFDYSMDTDDFDSMDVFFTTDCDFTTLEEQNYLDRSLCKNTNVSQVSNIQRCDSRVEKRGQDSENMKTDSIMSFQKQMEERNSPQTSQKRVTDVETSGTRYSRENCYSSSDDTAYRDSNVRSALSEIKHNRNSKALVSYFTKDNEYDSDDEILSQLDV